MNEREQRLEASLRSLLSVCETIKEHEDANDPGYYFNEPDLMGAIAVAEANTALTTPPVASGGAPTPAEIAELPKDDIGYHNLCKAIAERCGMDLYGSNAPSGGFTMKLRNSNVSFDIPHAIVRLLSALREREAEVGRLRVVVVASERFASPPCPACGYNGPGYYQPETHPCAAGYHAARERRMHLANQQECEAAARAALAKPGAEKEVSQ